MTVLAGFWAPCYHYLQIQDLGMLMKKKKRTLLLFRKCHRTLDIRKKLRRQLWCSNLSPSDTCFSYYCAWTQALATQLPIQLAAMHTLGSKSYNSNTWVPGIHMGNLQWAWGSWLLPGLSGCCRHWGNEPVYGRFLSLWVSLCPSNKQTCYHTTLRALSLGHHASGTHVL